MRIWPLLPVAAPLVLLAAICGPLAEARAQSARSQPRRRPSAAESKTNYGREARQETPLLWRDAESPSTSASASTTP